MRRLQRVLIVALVFGSHLLSPQLAFADKIPFHESVDCAGIAVHIEQQSGSGRLEIHINDFLVHSQSGVHRGLPVRKRWPTDRLLSGQNRYRVLVRVFNNDHERSGVFTCGPDVVAPSPAPPMPTPEPPQQSPTRPPPSSTAPPGIPERPIVTPPAFPPIVTPKTPTPTPLPPFPVPWTPNPPPSPSPSPDAPPGEVPFPATLEVPVPRPRPEETGVSEDPPSPPPDEKATLEPPSRSTERITPGRETATAEAATATSAPPADGPHPSPTAGPSTEKQPANPLSSPPPVPRDREIIERVRERMWPFAARIGSVQRAARDVLGDWFQGPPGEEQAKPSRRAEPVPSPEDPTLLDQTLEIMRSWRNELPPRSSLPPSPPPWPWNWAAILGAVVLLYDLLTRVVPGIFRFLQRARRRFFGGFQDPQEDGGSPPDSDPPASVSELSSATTDEEPIPPDTGPEPLPPNEGEAADAIVQTNNTMGFRPAPMPPLLDHRVGWEMAGQQVFFKVGGRPYDLGASEYRPHFLQALVRDYPRPVPSAEIRKLLTGSYGPNGTTSLTQIWARPPHPLYHEGIVCKDENHAWRLVIPEAVD